MEEIILNYIDMSEEQKINALKNLKNIGFYPAYGTELTMKKIPLKYVKIIGWISYILFFLLILLGCWLRQLWLILAACFGMLAVIIFLAVFNRCPHCWHFLGHAGGGTFCPYCGKKLEE